VRRRRLLTREERGAQIARLRLELTPRVGRVVSRQVLVELIAERAGYAPPKDQSAAKGWEAGAEMSLVDGLALAELAEISPDALVWTGVDAETVVPPDEMIDRAEAAAAAERRGGNGKSRQRKAGGS
jgi:hypothetical protein